MDAVAPARPVCRVECVSNAASRRSSRASTSRQPPATVAPHSDDDDGLSRLPRRPRTTLDRMAAVDGVDGVLARDRPVLLVLAPAGASSSSPSFPPSCSTSILRRFRECISPPPTTTPTLQLVVALPTSKRSADPQRIVQRINHIVLHTYIERKISKQGPRRDL